MKFVEEGKPGIETMAFIPGSPGNGQMSTAPKGPEAASVITLASTYVHLYIK